ncbi:branched-chain amino acid ABC transporter permease [Azospirillum sp. SYSU D00513]|uniref:branched-chain amino acid ABC transporter permease n=1 Tax=Azospirillum sp. SYSU D00513 TaxID=2812561 RepID=UPI001A96028A|nr:branched-chain amino acid ABC transporter permease [Azospirillum sp. SYSU D00513]
MTVLPLEEKSKRAATGTASGTLLERQGRWRWYELAFWLVPASCYFLFPDDLVLVSQVLIAGLFALSLDLLLGYGGIVSLGHAAFFGLGAYAAGLLAANGWSEPISGLLAAGAIAGAVGFALSFIIVRVHGIALLMVTLGISLVLHELAVKAYAITGGDDGLQGIVIDPILGIFEQDLWGRTAFVYSLVVVFLCFLLARQLTVSPFGLALKGMRENSRRMLAIGAPMRRHSALIYTISAAMAGIAGALLTQTTQFVSVEVLAFQRSAEVLIMLILGGAGHLYGAFVGAAVFMVARDELAAANPEYWFFWMGLMLVFVVLFLRGGILTGLSALHRRLTRAKEASR